MPDQQSDEEKPHPAAVAARGISATGPWGPVFGPLDVNIDAGGLVVLIGPAGSGRTALLMTLAGRMRTSSGTISVFGRSDARDIFATAALAGIEQLDSVSGSVTVQDLITEQCRWDARWYHLVGRADEKAREAICRPVFGELPLPRLTEYVAELDELDGLLLRIALANTARRPLLVVGSIDQVTSDLQRQTLVGRLADLGRHQTVVTTTVNDVPAGPGVRAQRLDGAELTGQGQIRDSKGDN